MYHFTQYTLFIALAVQTTLSFSTENEIVLDTGKLAQTTSSRFIGVAIDSGVIRRNWETFDPWSTKVKTLASALQPCYLRVGGTDADFLIFDDDGASYRLPKHSNTTAIYRNIKTKSQYVSRNKRDLGLYYGTDLHKDLTNYTMTAQFYDELNKFVSQVGWDLIFDLNVLLRSGGQWDPTNALKLIRYTAEKGYKMAGWELGNEPDEFNITVADFTVSPEQLVKDYYKLRAILTQSPQFKDSLLLGPSVAQLSVLRRIMYFDSFLNSGGGQVVTSASFHQYYINGRTAKLKDFMDIDTLNFLHFEVDTGVNLTRASESKAKVWIGETSSAWGGGAPNLSDRFVAGFMWLDKLGVAARGGVDVVIRQSFYGGHYALMDRETLDPNPDYWLTLLFKYLVGTQVLDVKSPNSTGPLRVYAHCTNTKRSGYRQGSVVIYMMNLSENETTVTLPQFNMTGPLHVYHLTPPGGDLTSQSVLLNGVLLRMPSDNQMPDLHIPYITTAPVTIPAKIFSFIVLPDADLDICKQ